MWVPILSGITFEGNLISKPTGDLRDLVSDSGLYLVSVLDISASITERMGSYISLSYLFGRGLGLWTGLCAVKTSIDEDRIHGGSHNENCPTVTTAIPYRPGPLCGFVLERGPFTDLPSASRARKRNEQKDDSGQWVSWRRQGGGKEGSQGETIPPEVFKRKCADDML